MKIEIERPLQRLSQQQLGSSKWWILTEAFVIEMKLDGVLHKIYVPDGYKYDRATIEWQVILTKDQLGSIGALIHDVFCSYKGRLPSLMEAAMEIVDVPWISPVKVFTRSEADDIFEAVMIADGVKRWRAKIARLFVRLGRNW